MELISFKRASEIHNLSYAILRYYVKRGYINAYNNKVDNTSIFNYIKSYTVVDMPNEVWKQLDGYSRYLFSNYGRIKSTKYQGGKSERIIHPAISGGYLKSIFLNDNGIYDSHVVHRLICLAFYPNDNYKNLEVNHKDANKVNNHIDNLEWVTRQQNMDHAKENNLNVILKGEQIGNSILKEWQVLEIRSKFKRRIYTRRMLSQEYNISEATIKEVVNRRTWRHI